MANTPEATRNHPRSLQPCSAAPRNLPSTPRKGGLLKSLHLAWHFLFNKPANTRPAGNIPVQPLATPQLLAAPSQTIFRLGHSSVLIKLRDAFFLTDPVFSERASPVQWAGPKRFHQPPISIEALPPIKAVILSHDHYDHLDRKAILKLDAKVEHFVTPRGVGDILIAWGVRPAKVSQLNWWESTQVDGIQLVATPAQHFSGRGLFDGNQTLWASWVVMDNDIRVFFSGDSGYFDGFKQIGERYGPFDLTLMETGAYDVNWPHVHMQPEETLQAHIDLNGRRLMPIHNGTFDLAMHAWHEPLERIVALAKNHGITIVTPQMGEGISLPQEHDVHPWWRLVDSLDDGLSIPIQSPSVATEMP